MKEMTNYAIKVKGFGAVDSIHWFVGVEVAETGELVGSPFGPYATKEEAWEKAQLLGRQLVSEVGGRSEYLGERH
jgi:hypothetical protein